MMSLNWFMPALVNINVGSSLITIGAEGTIWCPLLAKKLLKESLISLAVNMFIFLFLVLKESYCFVLTPHV